MPGQSLLLDMLTSRPSNLAGRQSQPKVSNLPSIKVMCSKRHVQVENNGISESKRIAQRLTRASEREEERSRQENDRVAKAWKTASEENAEKEWLEL